MMGAAAGVRIISADDSDMFMLEEYVFVNCTMGGSLSATRWILSNDTYVYYGLEKEIVSTGNRTIER